MAEIFQCANNIFDTVGKTAEKQQFLKNTTAFLCHLQLQQFVVISLYNTVKCN